MVRVVQYGIGPIGLEVVRVLLAKQSTGEVELVGVVDVDPLKIGRDVGELLSMETTGVVVSGDADECLAEARPDVVIHSTSSFIDVVGDQLLQCVNAGSNVISSTEELSFPDGQSDGFVDRLDRACKDKEVVVLGTGVNPGFAMDALAVMATAPCTRVDAIHVERAVDAGRRRGPLQRKIGAGITAAEFAEKKATGRFGHIGLMQSLRLVADALGFAPDEMTETLEPVVATRQISTDFVTVEEGAVAGIHQVAVAKSGGRQKIRLELKMAVGISPSIDRVVVDGDPPIDLRIEGGIFGDTATVGALVNAIPNVLKAEPGFKRVIDLPVGRAFAALR